MYRIHDLASVMEGSLQYVSTKQSAATTMKMMNAKSACLGHQSDSIRSMLTIRRLSHFYDGATCEAILSLIAATIYDTTTYSGALV